MVVRAYELADVFRCPCFSTCFAKCTVRSIPQGLSTSRSSSLRHQDSNLSIVYSLQNNLLPRRMAQLLQPQHTNPLHSPLGVHVNDARATRSTRHAERRLTSQSICCSSVSMNGGRLGCGSLRSPSVPRSHAAKSLGQSSSLHGTTTSRRAPGEVRRRPSRHVVRASSGDGSNPLRRPLAWLVDNIFPALAPILRQEQQQPDVQQGQQQRNQQQNSQKQQSQQSSRPQQSQTQQQDSPERQISAEASGAQEDSAANSFDPERSEPGYISELQGNPQQPVISWLCYLIVSPVPTHISHVPHLCMACHVKLLPTKYVP